MTESYSALVTRHSIQSWSHRRRVGGDRLGRQTLHLMPRVVEHFCLQSDNTDVDLPVRFQVNTAN